MEDMISNIMKSMPGFKFHPSDDELLLRYLKPKIKGTHIADSGIMPEIEVCQFDPWEFPTLFNAWKSQKGSREWIFFCPIKHKYLNSKRSKRTTPSGHWKVTGVERPVEAEDGTSIGTKKTLVFYKGRSPKGKRTNWVMHEYHLYASCLSDDSFGDQLPYVACRLKLKKDKKGVNTLDYPSEDSNNNSPYSSAAADCTHVNKGGSSLLKTPNSVIPEYHQVAGDSYNAADQDGISLGYVYALLPNLQHLDDGPMSKHNVHDDSNAILVNTSDYPSEDSNKSNPYSSAAVDYTHVNKGGSNLFKTPNSVIPEYHQVTGYPCNATDQDGISLDDVYALLLPSLQHLDDGPMSEHNVHDDSNAIQGVNTSDYPSKDLNNNCPYSSATVNYTHVNKGGSSLFNTPNSVIPEYYQVTGDPDNAADQDGISLDDVYALLPNLQHLDDGPMSKHNVHDDSNAIQGVNPSDYTSEGSNKNSPYSSAAADYTHVNKGGSSLFNTPNSVIPEYHQVTDDPYNATDQDEISLDDVFALLPNIQHLDNGPISKHNE